ncbi:MAG: pseudouridine synthase [Chloroflexota bacterium]|nr:pseudouridine synthase [Chloroflexota bacterium]
MTDSDRIRIAVAIARSGIASRRGAEVYVRKRRVAVDGRVTTDLSLRVDPGSQRITLDGEPLPRAEPLRYYALNKPRGVLSTARDDRGRRTVVDLLPGNAPRCVPVGRLDLDSEGLMLLSNDGPLIGALLHPSAEIQRVYLAEVIGSPTDDSLDAINSGIEDEGEHLQAKPARSRRPGRLLRDRRSTSWITLTLHTGRKRELRRLCAAIGHPVVTLRRVRFGPLMLRDLEIGTVRPLSRREIRLLRRAAGISDEA